MTNTWIYILIMALVTFIIRALPMTLIRKPINNKFIKSFLYYVPYVTLAVMTFPAIIECTNLPMAGLLALIIGVVSAWNKASLISVASICCIVVLIVESIF